MSAFSAARRKEIVTRAGARCEYCHFPTRGQVATFPIDHVIPESRGGTSDPSNLALACPHCNAHKWAAASGVDPTTGASSRLFHPRTDLWRDHFAWSDSEPGILSGTTAIGRATIATLHMNDEGMIELRVMLRELRLFEAPA